MSREKQGRRVGLDGRFGGKVPAVAPDWTDAACVDYDPEMWHPTPSEPALQARAICRSCPIIDVCREWALQIQPAGIWADTDPRQRTNILRKRARRAAA